MRWKRCGLIIALLLIAYAWVAGCAVEVPDRDYTIGSDALAGIVSVPAAVMVDAQAKVWTTAEVAADEQAALERNAGVKLPEFTYHEQYAYGKPGWTNYKWVDGVLVLDMYLWPMYRTATIGRSIASHEFSHNLAIAYLGDFTEGTADAISACFAKTHEPFDVTPEQCSELKVSIEKGALPH